MSVMRQQDTGNEMREFMVVLYRALTMITSYIRKRYMLE